MVVKKQKKRSSGLKKQLKRLLLVFVIFAAIFMTLYFAKIIDAARIRYNITVSLPEVENEELQLKITTLVEEEVEQFKIDVEENFDRTLKYDFIQGYQVYSNGDLDSILVTIKKAFGSDITVEHHVFYYDSKKDEELLFADLLISEKLFMEDLALFAYLEIKDEYNVDKLREIMLENIAANIILFDKYKVRLKLLPENLDFLDKVVNLEFNYITLNHFLVYKGTPTLTDTERRIRDVETFRHKRVIMFTYDDGPSGNATVRLLNELQRRDARVTFFVLGRLVEVFPDIVKRAHTEGHTIANHSYSHANLFQVNSETILRELNTTNRLINDLLGINNRFFRAPFGNSNDYIMNISGMSHIFWNIDPQDWLFQDANRIYNTIMSQARDGAIIVLHDIYETTVDGTIRAIDSLLRQGYAIISLEEAEQLGYIDRTRIRNISSLK